MIKTNPVNLERLKRFQDGYFYPRPVFDYESSVLSSRVVITGMRTAYEGLESYLQNIAFEVL